MYEQTELDKEMETLFYDIKERAELVERFIEEGLIGFKINQLAGVVQNSFGRMREELNQEEYKELIVKYKETTEESVKGIKQEIEERKNNLGIISEEKLIVEVEYIEKKINEIIEKAKEL